MLWESGKYPSCSGTKGHFPDAAIPRRVNQTIPNPYCDLVVFADPSLYPTEPRSPTLHVPRGHAFPANMSWQKSESSAPSSHGPHHFMGNAPPLTRTMTMPEPVFYDGPPTGATANTSQNPYGSSYPPPPQYHASMHHGDQPYPMTMPRSPPSNYPSAHGMSALRISSANLLLT